MGARLRRAGPRRRDARTCPRAALARAGLLRDPAETIGSALIQVPGGEIEDDGTVRVPARVPADPLPECQALLPVANRAPKPPHRGVLLIPDLVQNAKAPAQVVG